MGIHVTTSRVQLLERRIGGEEVSERADALYRQSAIALDVE